MQTAVMLSINARGNKKYKLEYELRMYSTYIDNEMIPLYVI